MQGLYFTLFTLVLIKFPLHSSDSVHDPCFLDRKKIVAVIDTTFAVVKRKPEKSLFSQLQKLCL